MWDRYEQSLPRLKTALGTNHELVVATQKNMCVLYLSQKQRDRCIDMHEALLEYKKGSHPPLPQPPSPC